MVNQVFLGVRVQLDRLDRQVRWALWVQPVQPVQPAHKVRKVPVQPVQLVQPAHKVQQVQQGLAVLLVHQVLPVDLALQVGMGRQPDALGA